MGNVTSDPERSTSEVSDEFPVITPTGSCFCGCGQSTKPGRYFVATHDRRAETKVIKDQYGSIAAFVVAHGYGPSHPDGGRQA